MKTGNIIGWFPTRQGRQFVFGGVCCLGMGISSAIFLSHTFLLKKYKEIVELYGLGIGVPLPAKVKRRFEEVMVDMQITDKMCKFIKPFSVFGFDMFHAGCIHTLSGAVVGIPLNFGYESTSDVDRAHVLVNLDQVSWCSDAGKQLLEAMVLSEEAQKFAIGREIAYIQTPYVYLNSVFPAIVITSMYAFATTCNDRLSLLSRPLPLRAILYSLVGLFGFGSWTLMKDFTTVHYETRVDKEMSALGESYIKGGNEFYSKLLNRNIALRKLMGNKGEKLFTATGNDQYMVRQIHMPLTLRKEFFQRKLEELKKQQEKSSKKVTSEKKSLNISHDADSSIPAPA